MGDEYSFGFPLYAVGQCADILAFRPQYVPVGEDQLPHLELSREVARKFDQLYCSVDPHTDDQNYIARGGLFPIIQPKLGRVKANGYAISNEELAFGLRSIAAPVLTHDGAAPAAINLAVHSSMTSMADVAARLPATLRRAAADISARLGYRP